MLFPDYESTGQKEGQSVLGARGAMGQQWTCKWLLTCWLCRSNFLQAAEEVAKHLQAMKAMLYGSGDQEPQTEVVAQLAQELYSSDMLLQLVDNLHRLDFEVRCTGKRRWRGVRKPYGSMIHTHTHTLPATRHTLMEMRRLFL